MKFEEVTWYSERLGRDMTVKIFGHYGPAFIAFPCQNGDSDDLPKHGMIDTLAPFIEAGKMKVFCIDSNDQDTFSSTSWDKAHAAYMLEQYHHYVVEELLPFVYDNMGGYCEPVLFGMSAGASHAANQFFRRPDLYDGFIALSGKYDLGVYFDGYMNEDVYNNSTNDYLRNMPNDHPYIDIYNQRMMIVCVGSGAWEHLVLNSNYELARIAEEKGIHIDFHFWDENSIHDWPSWKYQMPYFLNKILN